MPRAGTASPLNARRIARQRRAARNEEIARVQAQLVALALTEAAVLAPWSHTACIDLASPTSTAAQKLWRHLGGLLAGI